MDCDPVAHVIRARERLFNSRSILEKAKELVSVGQGAFDTDLNAYDAAVAQLITAYQNAAPNLATEDAEVKAGLAAVQAALTPATPATAAALKT
jgi:hypothetical protein